jgi:hypothetical protein
LTDLVSHKPQFTITLRLLAQVEALLRWGDTREAQLHQTRTLGAHLLAA